MGNKNKEIANDASKIVDHFMHPKEDENDASKKDADFVSTMQEVFDERKKQALNPMQYKEFISDLNKDFQDQYKKYVADPEHAARILPGVTIEEHNEGNLEALTLKVPNASNTFSHNDKTEKFKFDIATGKLQFRDSTLEGITVHYDYKYNSTGKLISEHLSFPSGQDELYTFDPVSGKRVTRDVTWVDGTKEKYKYDADGNQILVK